MNRNIDLYQTAMYFAGEAHNNQKVPGTQMAYVSHVANVTFEVMNALRYDEKQIFDADLGVLCAILHDVIEDTPVTYEDVEKHFGKVVADGVMALTKNESLPKEEQMADSLNRILQQPAVVRIVKMADRIDNLRQPPLYWTIEKRKFYQTEARFILEKLGGVNPYIEQRLQEKIDAYAQFFEIPEVK